MFRFVLYRSPTRVNDSAEFLDVQPGSCRGGWCRKRWSHCRAHCRTACSKLRRYAGAHCMAGCAVSCRRRSDEVTQFAVTLIVLTRSAHGRTVRDCSLCCQVDIAMSHGARVRWWESSPSEHERTKSGPENFADPGWMMKRRHDRVGTTHCVQIAPSSPCLGERESRTTTGKSGRSCHCQWTQKQPRRSSHVCWYVRETEAHNRGTQLRFDFTQATAPGCHSRRRCAKQGAGSCSTVTPHTS